MTKNLADLMAAHQKGPRPVFNAGPFLAIVALEKLGLAFNDVLRDPEAMHRAAASNFDLGFESTVLPFDLNVEAEALGAQVTFHADYDGIPVYPTVTGRPVKQARDLSAPDDLHRAGRVPAIAECLKKLKRTHGGRGLIGAFIPGPFTMAGQVMDPDELFVMTLKNPIEIQAILQGLTRTVMAVREVYLQAGADFITIEEGGATSVSPRAFRKLVLPPLQEIFSRRDAPHVLSLTGKADLFLEMMLECGPDAIGLDQESDLARARSLVPENVPLLAACGDYTLLADGRPDQVEAKVKETLALGVTAPAPPADLYPPARMENIQAFVRAAGGHERPGR